MSEHRPPMLLSGPSRSAEPNIPGLPLVPSCPQAGPAIHGTWARTYAPQEVLKRRCKDLCACSEDKQHFWRPVNEHLRRFNGCRDYLRRIHQYRKTNLDLQQNWNLWSDLRRGPHMRGQSQRRGVQEVQTRLLARSNLPPVTAAVMNWTRH